MNDQQTTGAAGRGQRNSDFLDRTPGLSGDARAMLRGASRPLLVMAAIAIVILFARPAAWVHEIEEVREWVHAQGLVGLVVVLVVYVVAAVALVPQTVLKVAAGGLFGSWLGVIVASIGSTLGAAGCFVIARYVARGTFIQRLKAMPRLYELDQISRDRGPMLVIVSRLLPIIPGNLLNYLLGLTQVRLATFTFWSWLAMLPGIVVLVVGTDALLRGLAEGRVPWGAVSIVVAMLVLLGTSGFVLHRRFRLRSGASMAAESR